jgi:hypothetical protein
MPIGKTWRLESRLRRRFAVLSQKLMLRLDLRQSEAVNLLQGLPGDALEIAVQPGGRFDDAADLRFALAYARCRSRTRTRPASASLTSLSSFSLSGNPGARSA